MQLNYVVTQVANTQPIVTASGFCNIDLFILPTVMKTIAYSSTGQLCYKFVEW